MEATWHDSDEARLQALLAHRNWQYDTFAAHGEWEPAWAVLASALVTLKLLQYRALADLYTSEHLMAAFERDGNFLVALARDKGDVLMRLGWHNPGYPSHPAPCFLAPDERDYLRSRLHLR